MNMTFANARKKVKTDSSKKEIVKGGYMFDNLSSFLRFSIKLMYLELLLNFRF